MNRYLKTRPGEANAALISICIIVFVSSRFIPGNPYVQLFFKHLFFDPNEVYGGDYWQLGTYILFHGGPVHLLFNMLALWQLGNILEEGVGSARYMLFVVVTAIISSIAQLLFSTGSVLGISGVVCAIVGYIWQARGDNEVFQIYMSDRAFRNIMLMLLGMVALDLMIDSISIAHYAHFTGLTFGAVWGRAFSQSFSMKERQTALIIMAVMTVFLVTSLVYAPWSKSWQKFKRDQEAPAYYEVR